MPRYLSDNIEIYKVIAESYNQVQKTRIASENRIRMVLKQVDGKLSEIVEKIKKNEREYKSMISNMLEEEPIWINFLQFVSGIGETVTMKLLSIPLDLEKNITNWWSYAGLVPYVYKCNCEAGHKILSPKEITICKYQDPETKEICNSKIISSKMGESRKYKGYKVFWNTKLKTLAFVITESFIKQGKYYRKCFDFYKKRAVNKGLQKGHAYMHAKRLTFKIFMSHLHQAGCEIYDVPYRKPYQFDILNHKSFIDWKEVVEIEKNID